MRQGCLELLNFDLFSNLAAPFIVLARKWRESLVMLKFSPHSQFACPICIVTPNLEESDAVVYTLRRQHTSTHFQPLEKGTGRIAELASTQLRLSIRICMPRRNFKSFLSGKFRDSNMTRYAAAQAQMAVHLWLNIYYHLLLKSAPLTSITTLPHL